MNEMNRADAGSAERRAAFDVTRTDWRGATFDSREVKPGMLFVALKGERCDGAKFIPQALEKGAAGVIEGREELARAARAYRRTLKATVVGVTGSAGKTTTKEFLRAFLATVGSTHATAGNFNNDIGLPVTILNCPRDAAFLVTEMGTNHPGEIQYLVDIAEPDAGVIASIGTAHIEFFRTQEGIAREKGRLFAGLKTFGVMPKGCACAEILRELCAGETVEADPQACPLECPLPGAHNRANMAVAWACARRLGATDEGCRAALARFALPGDRWRRVEKDGIRFISDCYNANPTSMIAALETFAAERDAARRAGRTGRYVAVLGDMFELGERSAELHADVKRRAAELGFDEVVYAGANFGGGTPEEARARLLPGDTVLLKASHGMHFEKLI